MRRPKHVKLKCGHCGKMFVATQNQAWRSTWASTLTKIFGCSRQCSAAIGVARRTNKNLLPADRLAYSRVSNALDCGRLVRPDTCQRCGNNPGLDRLGRSLIDAHHSDHSKPLEVEWLCKKCHRSITPVSRGETHPHAHFTERQVISIRKLLLEKRARPVELAVRYGVTHKAITDIRDRKTWRHV